MQNSNEVLKEKEKALQALSREVEALRIVVPLLADAGEEVPKKAPQSEDWRSLQNGADKVVARHNSAKVWP